jgi:hypothetical protein
MVNPCRSPIPQQQGFYVAYSQGKYSMNSNTAQPATNSATNPPTTARPNETGSISVQGFVKIFDPATQQIFVEKRA